MAEGEIDWSVFVVFRNNDFLQVAALSLLRNQVSKLPPGPLLRGGVLGEADICIRMEAQAKMPSLVLDKLHQISRMERPVAHDHNLRFVGKPACKRAEQGYLLIGVCHSLPAIGLPTDWQCPPTIRNRGHKHLPLSG